MRLPIIAFLCSSALAAGCADDPAPGVTSPCDSPAGALLGCPPPSASAEPPTIEEACARLVDCGVIFLDRTNADGFHFGDYTACVNDLRGDDYTADRLGFVLRCVDVASCQDLAEGHCVDFGGEAPQP